VLQPALAFSGNSQAYLLCYSRSRFLKTHEEIHPNHNCASD
jgi:hypothetical protein